MPDTANPEHQLRSLLVRTGYERNAIVCWSNGCREPSPVDRSRFLRVTVPPRVASVLPIRRRLVAHRFLSGRSR